MVLFKEVRNLKSTESGKLFETSTVRCTEYKKQMTKLWSKWALHWSDKTTRKNNFVRCWMLLNAAAELFVYDTAICQQYTPCLKTFGFLQLWHAGTDFDVNDKVSNQKTLYYAISNNNCFCTTWQNEETWRLHLSLKCCRPISALPEFNQSLLDFFHLFHSWLILTQSRCRVTP